MSTRQDDDPPVSDGTAARPPAQGAPVPQAVAQRGRLSARAISRAVLALALPVLGEQVLWMLLLWSDLYLAKTIQPAPRNAIAAIGWGGQFMWGIVVVFSVVAVGATAIVARSIGAGNRRQADRATREAMIAGFIVGAVTAGVAFVLAREILYVFGLRGAALADATVYVRIVVPGMSLAVLQIIGAACLRGAGNTRTPLAVVALANVMNVILSWSLRYGWLGLPKMGLRGIATGTLVAFIVGGLVMTALLVRGRSGLKARFWPLIFDLKLIRRMLRIGVFAGLEGSLVVSASVIVGSIVTHLSTADFAAYVSSIRLEGASFLPGIAFATAGGALVGQSLGAGRPDRAARYGWWAFAWGGGLMTLMGLVFIITPGPLARLFTGTEPQVARSVTVMLRICGFIQPWLGAMLIFAGLLRGAGDTRFPAAITVCSVGGLRVPGAYIAAHVLGLGLIGVWCVMMIDLFCRGSLMLWRFVHGGWKKTRV